MGQFDNEIAIKQRRVVDLLERHGLDGVMLWLRSNFAWITAGADNHIANNNPVGVAGILVLGDRLLCFANRIEAPRIASEEMQARGIEVVDFAWHDGSEGQRAAREIIADRSIAADVDVMGLGLKSLPPGFDELRWTLTTEEQERYRAGCRRASDAMEWACRRLKPGMTEHEIAGVLDHEIHCAGCNPIVTLVAADERIERFRHPIPTDNKLQRHAMLVTCAEYCGLIANLTRFVHFGPVSQDLKRRQQAVANIDGTVIHATKPGRTFGQMFEVLKRAYETEGFSGEWQMHHQGGSTGYMPRDIVASPQNPLTIRLDQAFAWNPSVAGAKSEDTVLFTDSGIEVLTAASADWPTIVGRSAEGELVRADALVL